jgi:hypothetical protein
MSSKKCYEATGNLEAVWADIESCRGCPKKDISARMGIEIIDVERALRQAKNRAGNAEVAKRYGKGEFKQVFVVHDENGIEVYIHFLYMSERQRDEADRKLRKHIASLQASGKKVAPEHYKRLILLQNYLLFVEGSEKEGTNDQ